MNVSNQSDQPTRRSDGEETHAAILDRAVALASIEGVNQITLGRLAQLTGVSKSGVYAHFRSKERLQVEIIEAAEAIYRREVIAPAYEAPDGLPRLRRLYDAYFSYIERDVFPGGCFFAGLISEFDAQSGPIHEMVVAGRREWDRMIEGFARRAQELGEIRSDLEPELLVFELDALTDHANFLYTLYRDQEMVERARALTERIFDRVATDRDDVSTPH